MRVLVCGGRDYHQFAAVDKALRQVHDQYGIDVLIHGAARGADSLGAKWAEQRGIPTLSFPADWDKHGRAAGHIRNAQMLDEGKPEGVVAFPGGRGTADMVRKARAAGIKVWEPYA